MINFNVCASSKCLYRFFSKINGKLCNIENNLFNTHVYLEISCALLVVNNVRQRVNNIS